MTPRPSKTVYALLAILFVAVFAFQCALSAEALSTIWSAGKHFKPAMLTGWDLELFGHVLAPFIALLLGFYVVGVRILDSRAWLLLAVLISFAIDADGSSKQDAVMLWNTPLKHLALGLRSFAVYTFPFWLALFALYFPAQFAWEQRNAKLKWFIFIPAFVLCCFMAVLRIIDNETNLPKIQDLRNSASPYWTGLFYLSVIFFLGLLTAKVVFAKSSDDRRRLRVLLFGMGLTLVPLTLLDITARLLRISEDDLPAWLLLPVFTLILSFPSSLAYVTVVERSLDIGVVVREGIQYALARRGVVLLQIFTSLIVIVIVAAFVGELTFFGRLMVTAIGIAAVIAVGVGAKHLGVWIDRRFFREAYDTEQVLNRLVESVRSIVELPLLLETVATGIAEALHVSRVAVFLLEENAYERVFCLGNPLSESLVFGETSSVVQELTKRHGPIPLYLGEPNPSRSRVNGREVRALHPSAGELFLPLAHHDSLVGFISLGAKKAEAPYSASDLTLLQSVASQTALAVENSRLTQAVASEVARRESAAREMEIAKAVQLRLFPQHCPNVPGLDCVGRCCPALDVGGDYYDWMELAEGELGIAIGDISGKGVPAALLMASLQASFRAITLAGVTDLGDLMAKLNLLMYDASPANRFATFFCGVYDSRSGRLRYSSAGHNPALLVRANSKEPAWLRTPGTALGLSRKSTFKQAELMLADGDRLILYTDGVTEARNLQGDEFGEQRLFETIRAARDCSAGETVSDVLEAVQRFAAGTIQHDDITLIAAVRH